jgi:hypothetical protein
VFLFLTKKREKKGGIMAKKIGIIRSYLVAFSYALGIRKKLPCDEY